MRNILVTHERFLDTCILCFGIETGTGLANIGQIAVAEDAGFGVTFPQVLQQALQGDLLLGRAGVGGFAVGRHSALVADADGVLVVALGMGTGKVLVTCLVGGAVLGDVPVVAGESEAGIVAGYEVLQGEPPVAARRTAVNDDKLYCSHIFLTEMNIMMTH